MAAGTYPFEHVADPTVAEARACLSAVILLNELGFREVVGDSLTIIKKLRVPVEDRLAITHTLAVEGWRFEGPRVWIEEALVVVETEADRDQREQIERNKEKRHRLWMGIGARVLLRYGGTWVLKNGEDRFIFFCFG
ncbi:hypothetical protein Goarm_022458 [Gossypium armourianum]|uniref:RNase H type-1 domain-containing protein n=1 Tax=Gossypium armourianum TaxID=34283 RepID=A0A7J9KEL7_9ROSI|nr:hypothetical protein [Gossypium armourianum]